jgi:hypothetical protein
MSGCTAYAWVNLVFRDGRVNRTPGQSAMQSRSWHRITAWALFKIQALIRSILATASSRSSAVRNRASQIAEPPAFSANSRYHGCRFPKLFGDLPKYSGRRSKDASSRGQVPYVGIMSLCLGISGGIYGIQQRLLFSQVRAILLITKPHNPVCTGPVPANVEFQFGHAGTPEIVYHSVHSPAERTNWPGPPFPGVPNSLIAAASSRGTMLGCPSAGCAG